MELGVNAVELGVNSVVFKYSIKIIMWLRLGSEGKGKGWGPGCATVRVRIKGEG